MRRVLAIARREIGAIVHSPIAAAVLCVFLVLAGYFFSSAASYYSLVSTRALSGGAPDPGLNLIEGVLRPFFTPVAVLLLIFLPLVSMRLFAEESRSGTLELLLSYPVRDGEVVLGKFLAALAFLALLLLGTVLDGALLGIVARPQPDPVPYATAFVGLLLLGSAFLSIGLFASSLTGNQIVAAVLSFGALLAFILIEWVGPLATPGTARVLTHLSIMEHFGDFAKGVVDVRDVAYYVLFTAFFLYAATRRVEMRRVKGL